MRSRLIIACFTAALTLGPSALAQSDSSQAVPDAPQPQKKPAAKPQPAQDPSSTDSAPKQPPAAKDDNAFPEAVSRQAAGSQAQDTTKKPTAEDNPFPEAVSREAAKDAEKAPGSTPDKTPATTPPRSDLPPGVSSSRSGGDLAQPDVELATEPQEMDPARAKKDVDVGGFYLKKGDYKGALLRYKDATASDPTNIDAIFGLAETQRMMKNNAEAARNYQLYLDIVPDGPKSKQALKALKELHSGNS